MSKAEEISKLLHEVGETHHTVFRISDGADEDWASCYSSWLVYLSELPSLLGGSPARSHLTTLLVELDRDHANENPDEPLQDFYARRILDELGAG